MTIEHSALSWTLVLCVLILIECQAATTPLDSTPTAALTRIIREPDPEGACQAALAYIRKCYAEEAPAPDLVWSEEQVTPKRSTGPSTFRYRAQDWVVTVSCPRAKPEAIVYQVVAMNQTTGFRWKGEVDSAGQVTGQALVPTLTPELEEDRYPGWTTYINVDYRFSFRYPTTWTLEEVTGCEEEAGGNIPTSLKLRRGNLMLVIGCERARQGVVLESRAGPGEWRTQGRVTFMGQIVPRIVLVHQGKDKAVYYNGTSGIEVDGLAFRIALIDTGADYQAVHIPKELQAEADQIVASFERILIRYCQGGTASYHKYR